MHASPITPDTAGAFQAASAFRMRASALETMHQLGSLREDASDPYTGNDTMADALGAGIAHARSAFTSAMLQIATDAENGAAHPAVMRRIADITPLSVDDIALVQGYALVLREMIA